MMTLSVTVAPYSSLLPVQPTKTTLREALRDPYALANGEFSTSPGGGRYATIRELVDAGIESLEVRRGADLVAVVAIGRKPNGDIQAVVA